MLCVPTIKFLSDVPDEILDILDKEIESWDFRNYNNFLNIAVFDIVKSISYTETDTDEKYITNIAQVFKWLELFFPDKTPIYANMLAIFPGQRYPVHIDALELHIVSNRIHIPVITDSESKLWFFKKVNEVWAEDTYHIKRGEAWEISNVTPHSAENLSNFWRVHFVVDLIDKQLKESKDYKFWRQVNEKYARFSNLINLEFEKNQDPELKRWSQSSVKENNKKIISACNNI